MERLGNGTFLFDNGRQQWRVQTELVFKSSRFLELVPEILRSKRIALDTETTGLRPTEDQVVGLCVGWDYRDTTKSIFVPIDPPYQGGLPKELFGPFLSIVCTNPDYKLLFHNAKFDIHMMGNTFGFIPHHDVHDTMVMSHLYDETLSKALKFQASLRIDNDAGIWESTMEAKYTKKKNRWWKVAPVVEFGEYGAIDAALTLALDGLLFDYVTSNFSTIYGLEQKMIVASYLMEREGFLIDSDHLNRVRPRIEEHLTTLESRLHEIAGYEVNPGSPKQVAELIFGKLGFPVIKKTPKGKISADSGVLERVNHPAAETVLAYRANKKLLGTYVDGILGKLTQRGRLHSSYVSTGTRTGRFSSREPNLQQMPREGSLPFSIRRAFIPDQDHQLIFADFSQMEFRMFAEATGDRELIGVLNDPDTDIHTWTAAQVFHKNEENVTTRERKFAKAINFGIIYGIGAQALSWRLKITEGEAKKFLRQYHKAFPAIGEFIAKHKSEVEGRNGRYLGWEWRRFIWDTNFFGRRRFFWPTKSYVSINTWVQGTCADILKTTLASLLQLVQSSELKLKGVVHDETIFSIHRDQVENVVPEIKRLMENFHFRVMLPVEFAVSDQSWGQKRPWGG